MNNSIQTKIAIVGAGPSGLVMAIALARKSIPTIVFERDLPPNAVPRFNPDRSYPVDITGHGVRALRYINACDTFDEMLFPFNGIKSIATGVYEPWTDPGWTGSRGDILHALIHEVRTKYSDLVTLEYESNVNAVDILAGEVKVKSSDSSLQAHHFDLIIGADGSGSVVRQAMSAQLTEFTTEYDEIPNYSIMVELDRNIGHLDKSILYVFNTNPFCVAGAVQSNINNGAVHWVCVVGTGFKQIFKSTEEARRWLQAKAPLLLDMMSEASLAAFAKRKCFHIGKLLSCSQLFGGKAVLLGDAGAPFSPVGQGVNAAMESAIVLDQQLDLTNEATIHQSICSYSEVWKPEADAVSWISRKFVYGNKRHAVRVFLASKLKINPFADAKKVNVSYSEMKRRAERFGPVWR